MIDCRVVSTFRVEAGKKAETKIAKWRTNQPRTTIVLKKKTDDYSKKKEKLILQ